MKEKNKIKSINDRKFLIELEDRNIIISTSKKDTEKSYSLDYILDRIIESTFLNV